MALTLGAWRGSGAQASSLRCAPFCSRRLRCFDLTQTRLRANAAPEEPPQGSSKPVDGPKRFAVVGGGFAGVAAAWNLLAMTGGHGPTSVDLFDAVGLAGGGSGASAGLLHPYTPTGKMLWCGKEALVAALKLISAAELASSIEDASRRPFVWRQPILRPASSPKQAGKFAELRRSLQDRAASTVMASPLSADQALQIVPGLDPSSLLQGSDHAALLIQGGLVLDPHRYLRALWDACLQITKDAGRAAEVRLIQTKVTSLTSLEAEYGPYAAIVVAAGAANGVIEDIGDQLGCELSHGYALQLVPRKQPPKDPEESLPGTVGQVAADPAASAGNSSQSVATSEAASNRKEKSNQKHGSQSPASSTSGVHPERAALQGTKLTESEEASPQLRWPDVGQNPEGAPKQELSLAAVREPNSGEESVEAEAKPPSAFPAEIPAHNAYHPAKPLIARPLGEPGLAAPPFERSAEESRGDDDVDEVDARDVGEDRSSWHWRRQFPPAFAIDTGTGFDVRGESTDFDSCLREQGSVIWEGQQQQIRQAVGLQIDPRRNILPEEAHAERLEESLTAGWDTEEDMNEEDLQEGYPEGAPSLLASKYLAAQGRNRLILGGNRRNGLTADQAFQECGRKITDEAEKAAAAALLLPDAVKLWKPIKSWRVRRVRSGVRALPPKTEQGAMPLAGRIRDGSRWWVIGGLGARGLVYHAWLGELVAQAVLNNSEDGLPKELLRWKSRSLEVAST